MLQIKDFKITLKDFEQIVKGGDKHGRLWLLNGNNLDKKIDSIPIEDGGCFNLRYREAWANRLLCVVMQNIYGTHITFAEDEVGDGFILDKITGKYIQTEHVAAMNFPNGNEQRKGEERIIKAIKHKIDKGSEYGKGKTLIVFFDGADKRYPHKVSIEIAGTHNFDMIYCIGLVSGNEMGYTYSVTQLSNIRTVTYLVKINSNFTDREIHKHQ